MYKSAVLDRLWRKGICTVQPLVRETASYCARYIMKKALGEEGKHAYELITADGEVLQRKPEYAAMSLRPGIGSGWFDRYRRDVFPCDYVVQRGIERRVPKYYDRLLRRADAVAVEPIEYARLLAAREAFAEQSEARLQAREVVHLAKVSTLARGLE